MSASVMRVAPWTLAALAVFVSGAAHADEWFGADKALHFGASALIASGGYAISAPFFAESRAAPLLIGGGVAVAAGVGKELYDATGRGDPSAKDLVWDAAGVAVGLLVAVGVDALVRGPSLGSRDGANAAALSRWGSPGGVTIRF